MKSTTLSKLNKRLTVYEVALTGIILGIALAARYFDTFIPHVHPIAVVIILIGVATMRLAPSIILVGTFIGMKYILFGFSEISPLMAAFHILQWMSILLFATSKLLKTESKVKRYVFDIFILTITMLLFLTFMIIGDSEYSAGKGIEFAERLRLAIIWPGDWMNVTITWSISIVIVPLLHLIHLSHIEPRLQRNLW